MAGALKGITVEIGGDTTKLGKALGEVNSSAKSLQSELRGVNSLLKMDPGNVTLLTQKQDLLTASIDKTKSKLDTLKEAQVQVQEQFDKGEITEEQYRDFQREIIATEKALENLEEEAKNFGSVGAQHIAAVGTKVQETGSKVEDLGKKFSVLSASIVAIGTASIAATMEMDDGYDTVVTKTGATGEALEDLKSRVDDVFTSLPTTAEDAGIAIGEVNTRFGLTGEACSELSKQFIEFANINGTDLNTAIDNVDEIMTKFGVDSKDTASVLGILTKAGQDTGLSMETLEGALTTNGSAFKEMGLDLTSSVNLLAQLEANGVDTSIAITGLKKAVINATSDGKSADEALKETIDSIKNAETETEALSAATELFGSKGAAEMTQAIREGRLSIDDLTGSLGDYASTVEDTYNETLDPWDETQVALNNLKVAGSQLGESILTTLQPAITKLVEKAKELTSWFTNLSDGQKEMIVKVAGIVAAIGPVLIVVGKVIGFIGTIMTWVPKIQAAITAIKTACIALNAVMAANPIALIVIAIVGVIAILVTLYNKCEWFRNAVNAIVTSIIDFIKGAIDSVVNFFTVTIPNAFNTVINFVKENWQGLLLLIVNPFAGAFKLLYDNCEGFRTLIDNTFTAIKEFFVNLWNNIVLIITTVWTTITTFITTTLTTIQTTVTNIFNAIKNTITTIWDTIKNTIVSIITGIQNTMTSIFTNIKTAVSNIFTNMVSAIKTTLTSGKTAITTICSNILSGMLNIFSNIRSTFGDIGRNVIEGIKDGITGAVSGLYDSIKNALSGLVDKAKSALGIHSPSRIMRDQIGKYIPAGVAEGIEENENVLTKSVGAMARQTVDTAEDAFGGSSGVKSVLSNNQASGGVVKNITNTVTINAEKVDTQHVDEICNEINRRLGMAF